MRIGLSMEVRVDTEDQSGKALADVPRTAPVAATTVFDTLHAEADADVQRIIAASLGRAGASSPARPRSSLSAGAPAPAGPP